MAVLIVDDDPVQRRLLEGMVRKFGYEVVTAEGGDAAAALLTGPDGAGIDCVILDLVMPDLDGLGVLARLRATPSPRRSSSRPRMAASTTSSRRCARARSISWSSRSAPSGLQVSLRNALNTSALEGELDRIKRSRSGTLGFKDIITKSPRMQAVLRMAREGGGLDHPGADRWRIRRRQGADRARDPRLRRAAGEAVRCGQLRRDAPKI